MSAESDVRKASEKFYAAMNRMGNDEMGAMSDVWAHGPTVTAMHPMGGRTMGRDVVRDSFDQVASMATDSKIGLNAQFIQVHGDVACELGVEHGEFKMAGQPVSLEHRVTNLYKREGGMWRLIHHHTDSSAGMLDVFSLLQPPSA